MSQSRYSSQDAMSQEIVNQMIRREKKYKEGIQQNHDFGCVLAQSLAPGGRLEGFLGNEKMEEYRQALRQLAETNVQHERQVNAFVSTLRKSSQQTDVNDFSTFISENKEKELQKINQNSVQVHQERMYLDMCTNLGDKSASNDDDELEVVGGNSTNSLKCPITGTLLSDPMRNMVCHHVYSKHAILDYIRKRNNKCPQVGCGNTSLSLGQLEDDHQTARLVRREMIRQEQEQQQRSQNALDLDEDD